MRGIVAAFVSLLFTLCAIAPAIAEQRLASDAPRHWSFTPPNRPVVPTPKNAAWVRNPIDAFIAFEQEKRGLAPQPEADKSTLLRRVYLDLIGLPPTRGELRAFRADASPDAYERVVDALLASPRYGERWGRHWMDVWRYSDWAGYGAEVRDSQPYLWRWRDWIIESVNQDKGYDRMVQEMLAGDELAPGDPQTLRATGYLARNYYKFNRNVWLENTVEHSAKAFLGLTMNCAKCHDHKYDPISQKEHYEFRALFETYDVRVDPAPGELDPKKDGITVAYDGDAAARTFLFIRGNEMSPDTQPLPPAVPAFLGGHLAIHPIDLPATAWYPGLRPAVQKDVLSADDSAIALAEKALATANQALAAARKAMAPNKPAAHPDALSELEGEAAKSVKEVPSLPAKSTVAPDPKNAETALRAAEYVAALAGFHLAEAQARRTADAARIAADNARFAMPPAANAHPLALAANRAELAAKVLKAREEVYLSTNDWPAAPVPPGAKVLAKKPAAMKPAAAAAALALAIKALDKPTATYAPLTPVYPTTSTGRRLALARWITARDNPLAARVAVNHIWMRHFGEPLVETVFDFGKNGRPPTNPQLLDWMAVELMEPTITVGRESANGLPQAWSMKHLHRLIVTSSAYRMQSSNTEHDGNVSIDPDNKYLWRMNPRRLEAEAVRDNLLFISGQLDLTVGGPDLDQNTALTVSRRSIYFRNASEKQVMFLKVFDVANPSECYRRMPTVMPQQALALSNSPLAQSAARKLAAALTKEAAKGDATDSAFITAAFEQILCRDPQAGERAACAAFLSEQARSLSKPNTLTAFGSGDTGDTKPSPDPAQRTREDLVHVLLNHNDFVTIR